MLEDFRLVAQSERPCDVQIRQIVDPPPAVGGQLASYEGGSEVKEPVVCEIDSALWERNCTSLQMFRYMNRLCRNSLIGELTSVRLHGYKYWSLNDR
jgi:hypothetical protein